MGTTANRTILISSDTAPSPPLLPFASPSGITRTPGIVVVVMNLLLLQEEGVTYSKRGNHQASRHERTKRGEKLVSGQERVQSQRTNGVLLSTEGEEGSHPLTSVATAQEQPANTEPLKRGRGRPRKHPQLPVPFKEVAVYLIREEWDLMEQSHRALYKEVRMKDNRNVTSAGGNEQKENFVEASIVSSETAKILEEKEAFGNQRGLKRQKRNQSKNWRKNSASREQDICEPLTLQENCKGKRRSPSAPLQRFCAGKSLLGCCHERCRRLVGSFTSCAHRDSVLLLGLPIHWLFPSFVPFLLPGSLDVSYIKRSKEQEGDKRREKPVNGQVSGEPQQENRVTMSTRGEGARQPPTSFMAAAQERLASTEPLKRGRGRPRKQPQVCLLHFRKEYVNFTMAKFTYSFLK
ncbi:hypothetical protein JD844_013945 [Phrynosoma platyrhinos]|uniref:KRAB domain-containing protein n=1 Tax=Phrynosoma platyrhinos TaxID=52577 RepID=A0ABQ7TMN2_PHRPL|nr:hypothetical protein JD844_013945 [Phrynosoma platyrhinos]